MLLEKYKTEVRGELKEQFSYGNDLEIPVVQKVTVNMGVGKAVTNKGMIEAAVADLAVITGQKPVITKARRSISQFRLRKGTPIGAKVTLRGKRMYEFLERLFVVVIPRLRDFRGLPNKLDGRGNYSLGLAEQSVFPEINLDKVQFVQGMDITISTTARTDEECVALLQGLGCPFKRDDEA
ncbi:MAG: 50S ribosomal protein L5 [Planctomycetes bacterium]|jgi:large subunit ribosomal protein L5|nr:50S ribosomal protein L5 [Planctomycetota bacterium]